VLREAQCLHAKSRKENEDIRQFGLRNPVGIIANPISAPPEANRMSERGFRDAYHLGADAKILLFLGRLHPVKGLPRLVRAWSQFPEHHQNWVLVLAGPDEAGHRKELETLVVELHCQNRILFTGELDEARKWSALAAADLFVMPSDFENFGSSIVEAMACGVPVITTTGTPWKELPGAGAGWCVEPALEPLAGALREALGLSDEQRHNLGRRAADLASRFRPEKAAADLISVYQWLLGRGERPGCVVQETAGLGDQSRKQK
jgi:glycosyltransferase involved in cell wall biosynthesis